MKVRQRRGGSSHIVAALSVLAVIVVATAFGIFSYAFYLRGNTQTQTQGTETTTTVVVVNNSTKTNTNTTQNPNANVQYQGPAAFSGAGQSGAQITVPAGTNVSVAITVSSTAATSGLLTVNVREDIVDAPDSQAATLQHDVSLAVGSNTITMGSFVAKDVTTGAAFAPREYFISVAWNSQSIYDPTDPSTREWVKTVSGPGTTNAAVSYVSGTFSGAGQTGPQITVPIYTSVGLKVTVNANGSAEGVLSVNVRKDIVWYPDASYTTLTKTVQLTVGSNSFDMGTFVMADNTCGSPGCVREYFYTVSWNGQLIYNPTDPSTREWVKTTSSGTTTTTTSTTGPPPPPPEHPQIAYVFPGTFSGAGQSGSQITVPIGTLVDLKVKVSSNMSVTETISADIRKDIVWYPDVSYTTLTKTVHLGVGTNTVDLGTFVAIDSMGGLPGQIREYFYTVSANGTNIYNPTDPSTREWVKTSFTSTTTTTTTTTTTSSTQQTTTTTTTTPTATVAYVFPGTFSGAGQSGSQITVPQGTIVSVSVSLAASGSTCGNLTVEVRADVVWLPDSTVQTLTLSVCLNAGSNSVAAGTFVASALTGGWPGQTREYFIRVYWNGQTIYNPTDPSTREWVKTT